MKKKLIAFFLFSFIVLCGVYADGAGGIFFSYQTARYPFLENYPVKNNSLGLMYYGGYGYGIDRKGNINGGFGFSIHDEGFGIVGGFGGFITGYRILKRPLTLSVVTWTGLGGIYTGEYETSAGSGFFSILFELDLEVGIPVTRWFMPVLYAGYQVIGNVIPGEFFTHFFSYSPVIGLRLCWGLV